MSEQQVDVKQQLVEVKTIGEVERIVHASGLWDGTGPVEFSDDGDTWRDTWAPTDGHRYPEYARVTVYRKEVRVPTTVTIRWDEQVPTADPFWAGKWASAPMRHFGRTARMVAYRQTFRELLGDIVIEDEDREDRPSAPPAEPAPRDWAAEIAAADTLAALDKIDTAARKARVFTPDAAGTALHRALRAKRMELAEDSWKPLPVPQTQPERRGLDPIHPVPGPPKPSAAVPKPTEPRRDRPRRQRGLTSVEDVVRQALAKRDQERKP